MELTTPQLSALFTALACIGMLILISYRAGLHTAHTAHAGRLELLNEHSVRLEHLLHEERAENMALRHDMEALENDHRLRLLTVDDAQQLVAIAVALDLAAGTLAGLEHQIQADNCQRLTKIAVGLAQRYRDGAGLPRAPQSTWERVDAELQPTAPMCV